MDSRFGVGALPRPLKHRYFGYSPPDPNRELEHAFQQAPMNISVVVPVYNSAQSLRLLVDRLEPVLKTCVIRSQGNPNADGLDRT
jgi:hypothetical protein